ncbi:arginine deiminase [Caldisalinibacter kiritimatiensis]|uniref:Arginine deiminase n=1 Tax=Caldisalinibacter kiritimatiensis TaxID=1304284 RepID=R1AVY8_9FIRM|nr:arginine deiminase [Caldisalinibacter kiritimatiensis]EOD01348.1 Arginine deiminase [Caldisalinibacter kiritimatiensis]
MNNSKGIHVYNEIGKLKTVLLHRPGNEIENLIPKYLKRLLFDDIAYLTQAQKEHDKFSKILTENGVEVLYLTDLINEALIDNKVRKSFIYDFFNEVKITSKNLRNTLMKYLNNMSSTELVRTLISGIKVEAVPSLKNKSLADMVREKVEYPFYLDPIPNLYFQRDPFASIGSGISLNVMSTPTRRRETLFAHYIFKYHPRFKEVIKWYERTYEFPIEGGDILVLSPKILAIGISQRTTPEAIEIIASRLFKSNESFETVLAFDIPRTRAYMHLDTVFTMVDYEQFTIHPGIEKPLNVYSIRKSNKNDLYIKFEQSKLSDILKKYLNLSEVNLIRCGGGDYIAAGREQWSDGSNTLAISPGVVVCYDRNYVTNQVLRQNGIKVLEIPSYELSRGRGGPRCMSMPIIREDI